MADQTKEVTRFVIGPALVTEVGKEVLVNPPPENNGIGSLLHAFRFPVTDKRVQELVNEARRSAKEGLGSRAYVTTQYTYQCTEDFNQKEKINEEQCSLVGVRIGFQRNETDQALGLQPFPKDKEPEVKFTPYKPNYFEEALYATGEKLYNFSDWVASTFNSKEKK